jgi:hypothetical protein
VVDRRPQPAPPVFAKYFPGSWIARQSGEVRANIFRRPRFQMRKNLFGREAFSFKLGKQRFSGSQDLKRRSSDRPAQREFRAAHIRQLQDSPKLCSRHEWKPQYVVLYGEFGD